MAAHRQIDGVYQWDLTLPPASAAALLSAVCVNLDSPRPGYVRNLFWGPKSWTIRFEGHDFELRTLGRGNIYSIFGLPWGTIVPTKLGCRIELRRGGNYRIFYVVFALAAVLLSVGWGIGIMNFAADFALWLRVLAIAVFSAWFVFGFLWLMPREPVWAYLDFIDDLFANYIVPSVISKQLP